MEQLFDINKVIETNRLIMRFTKVEDSEDLFNNILHDKEVLNYFVTPYVEKLEDAKIESMVSRAIEAKRYLFSIVLKETNEVIGFMLQGSVPSELYNSTELGYAIGKKHWNNGYTTEALKAMTQFMKELGIHRIFLDAFLENIASQRVMKKCGFIKESVTKDAIFYRNRYWDFVTYYMINENSL